MNGFYAIVLTLNRKNAWRRFTANLFVHRRFFKIEYIIPTPLKRYVIINNGKLKKIKLAFHLFDIFCVLPIKKYTQIYVFFHKIIIAHYCFFNLCYISVADSMGGGGL